MKLPLSGKAHIDKAIQDTSKSVGGKKLPLRESARATVYAEKLLYIEETVSERVYEGELRDA